MRQNIGLLITAAGSGSRFSEEGKIFYIYKGKPLIQHTLEKFEFLHLLFSTIVITIERSSLHRLQQLVAEHFSHLPISVIEGGAQRSDSVYKGLSVFNNVDQVLIHDGARAFVSPKVIRVVVDALSTHKAVIPGIACVDTIKQIDDGQFVQKTLPRETLISVQTPQGFDYSLIMEAYERGSLKTVTDEAMLIEQLGEPVFVVPGDRKNIKVTYLEDVM